MTGVLSIYLLDAFERRIVRDVSKMRLAKIRTVPRINLDCAVTWLGETYRVFSVTPWCKLVLYMHTYRTKQTLLSRAPRHAPITNERQLNRPHHAIQFGLYYYNKASLESSRLSILREAGGVPNLYRDPVLGA